MEAPGNFFYSKSYRYQFAGPFTHWGGITTWTPNERWQFQTGLTNGWNGFDRTTDRLGMLASAKYTSELWWTSFAITVGQDFNNTAGLPGVAPAFTERDRYSWLVGLKMTSRLDYVFHQWLGIQDQALADGRQAQWYGIDQYMFYTINDRWKAGARFEWFHDDDGTRVGLNRASNPNNPPYVGNFYSLSFGVNYSPTQNFIVRPEIRSDWYTGNSVPRPYQDGAKTSQLMLGLDAIYKF